MKVYSRIVIDWTVPDLPTVEAAWKEYDGPVALCGGDGPSNGNSGGDSGGGGPMGGPSIGGGDPSGNTSDSAYGGRADQGGSIGANTSSGSGFGFGGYSMHDQAKAGLTGPQAATMGYSGVSRAADARGNDSQEGGGYPGFRSDLNAAKAKIQAYGFDPLPAREAITAQQVMGRVADETLANKNNWGLLGPTEFDKQNAKFQATLAGLNPANVKTAFTTGNMDPVTGEVESMDFGDRLATSNMRSALTGLNDSIANECGLLGQARDAVFGFSRDLSIPQAVNAAQKGVLGQAMEGLAKGVYHTDDKAVDTVGKDSFGQVAEAFQGLGKVGALALGSIAAPGLFGGVTGKAIGAMLGQKASDSMSDPASLAGVAKDSLGMLSLNDTMQKAGMLTPQSPTAVTPTSQVAAPEFTGSIPGGGVALNGGQNMAANEEAKQSVVASMTPATSPAAPVVTNYFAGPFVRRASFSPYNAMYSRIYS
ncbi:MAG: hypothetical protein AB1916_04855 [Thermodesulfobacteriota bacterium]